MKRPTTTASAVVTQASNQEDNRASDRDSKRRRAFIACKSPHRNLCPGRRKQNLKHWKGPQQYGRGRHELRGHFNGSQCQIERGMLFPASLALFTMGFG